MNKKNYPNVGFALIFVVTISAIYGLYLAPYLNTSIKLVAALLLLIMSGMLIKRIKSTVGSFGFYLVGTKAGIKTVHKLASSHSEFWNAMATWGIILSFGVLSYFILGRHASKKFYAVGLASLMAIMVFVLPFISYSLAFIKSPQLQSLIPQGVHSLPSFTAYASSVINVPLYSEIIRLLAFAGGFALFVISSLVYNASYIIYILMLHPTVATLASQSAGATLALPGVTLPLFAGIVSLVMLLIIHEFSHGILSSLSKVKLKQIGLLMFGVIPFGAFVEPDEKKIVSLNKLKQNKISSAGISANFIAMIIFFILMVLTIPVIYSGYTTHGISYDTGIFIKNTSVGYPAYGVLKPGMHIISWNGHNVTNATTLISAASSDFAGSRVNIVTNTGKYSFTAKAVNSTSRAGVIGVSLYESGKIIPSNMFWGFAYFIYSVFAISFMLNFLIGIMNLLPIPGFDGWRIFKLSISNSSAVKALSIIVVLALMISLLPAATQL